MTTPRLETRSCYMGTDPKTKEESMNLIERMFEQGQIPGTFTRPPGPRTPCTTFSLARVNIATAQANARSTQGRPWRRFWIPAVDGKEKGCEGCEAKNQGAL